MLQSTLSLQVIRS